MNRLISLTFIVLISIININIIYSDKSTQKLNSNYSISINSVATATPGSVVYRPEGTVLEQASCRYGPGTAYLFEWGLYLGDFVLIINRNNDGSWLYVKPDTFKEECWVKADLLDIKGDIFKLPVYISELPRGHLYKQVHYINAKRVGEDIYIQWEVVKMTEDDDRGYLIEVWICRDNKLVFQPIAYFPYTNNHGAILDEPGCRNRSYGHIFTVEKHGYIYPWLSIPWPAVPPSIIQ